MEFQEGLMRLMIQEKSDKQRHSRKTKKTTDIKISETQADIKKPPKWKIFPRSPSSTTKTTTSTATTTEIPLKKEEPTPSPKEELHTPSEFLCPITGSLMAEPVIVSSGHTFERACVEACKALSFSPAMADSSVADFSSVIPNLALKSSITAWCRVFSVESPRQPNSAAAESLVRSFMASRGQSPMKNEATAEEKANSDHSNEKAITLDLSWRRHRWSFSSRESVEATATRLRSSLSLLSSEADKAKLESSSSSASEADQAKLESSPSSSSSSEADKEEVESSSSTTSLVEVENPSFLYEEEEILAKLRSQQVFDMEDGVAALREITCVRKESRGPLCTYRLLAALRPLVPSRFTGIQVNSVAALVNLSLERSNKSKIVRSGMLPLLIDVLKCGSLEAQEHATGAIFSLALDDENKAAIGVLGALQPLIRLLRAESYRTRHDAVLALYHLSLVRTNRSKLVKLGAVSVLLNMVRSGNMTGLVMMVLSSLSLSEEGRILMMNVGAVECVAGVLSGDVGSRSRSAREGGVMILYALSHGGLRFRLLAKEAGVMGALRKVEEMGSERAKERARMVVEAIKGRAEEVEDVNWEELLEQGFESENRSRLSSEAANSMANSSV